VVVVGAAAAAAGRAEGVACLSGATAWLTAECLAFFWLNPADLELGKENERAF